MLCTISYSLCDSHSEGRVKLALKTKRALRARISLVYLMQLIEVISKNGVLEGSEVIG